VVWNFSDAIEERLPAPNPIIGSDGSIYGTTEVGGANGGGTLFQFTPGGSLSVMWAFGAGTDGSGPSTGVTEGSDGNFYGTTVTGGTIQICGASSYGCGTIFRVTPAGEETRSRLVWRPDVLWCAIAFPFQVEPRDARCGSYRRRSWNRGLESDSLCANRDSSNERLYVAIVVGRRSRPLESNKSSQGRRPVRSLD
jgi:uncharacterized repeat protein (TIGR03803 family)